MLEGDLGVDELLLKIPTCWLEREKLLENGLRFLPVLREKFGVGACSEPRS
jgi:hypothetical protein